MTPAAALDMLERQIAENGQEIVVRREVANGDPILATVKASVRGYRPGELIGGISQGDSLVAISPRHLAAKGFPGLPKSNDTVVVAGRHLNVIAPDPVFIGGEVVRINLQVSG